MCVCSTHSLPASSTSAPLVSAPTNCFNRNASCIQTILFWQSTSTWNTSVYLHPWMSHAVIWQLPWPTVNKRRRSSFHKWNRVRRGDVPNSLRFSGIIRCPPTATELTKPPVVKLFLADAVGSFPIFIVLEKICLTLSKVCGNNVRFNQISV